jgi:hypothetical protein
MVGISCPPPECPDGQIYSERWSRPIDQTSGRPSGDWRFERFGCAPDRGSAGPSLPDLVEREFRNLQVPALRVQTQPRDRTLVNLDTIFYVEPGQRDFPVGRILGRDVVIRVEGVSYVWNFGDDQTFTSTSPGAKYPSEEIVHRYRSAGETVRPFVTVTYRGSFSVDGGGFQRIPGTVTVVGPPSDLEIAEARSELVAGS